MSSSSQFTLDDKGLGEGHTSEGRTTHAKYYVCGGLRRSGVVELAGHYDDRASCPCVGLVGLTAHGVALIAITDHGKLDVAAFGDERRHCIASSEQSFKLQLADQSADHDDKD